MVGFKKSTGGASPGPKKSSKAKVSVFFYLFIFYCLPIMSIYPCIHISPYPSTVPYHLSLLRTD